MTDCTRLLSIIKAAPNPYDKTDSEIAKLYRVWYYGARVNKMTAAEQTTEDDKRSTQHESIDEEVERRR